MLCHCDACNYTFEASVFHSKYEIPKKCPKCRKKSLGKGTPAVRAATDEEAAEYVREQQTEMEEMFDRLNDGLSDKDNIIPFPGCRNNHNV